MSKIYTKDISEFCNMYGDILDVYIHRSNNILVGDNINGYIEYINGKHFNLTLYLKLKENSDLDLFCFHYNLARFLDIDFSMITIVNLNRHSEIFDLDYNSIVNTNSMELVCK
jgi:hypothetical protein